MMWWWPWWPILTVASRIESGHLTVSEVAGRGADPGEYRVPAVVVSR